MSALFTSNPGASTVFTLALREKPVTAQIAAPVSRHRASPSARQQCEEAEGLGVTTKLSNTAIRGGAGHAPDVTTNVLEATQFYTRSLIESNIDVLMATDPQGAIADMNRNTEARHGY